MDNQAFKYRAFISYSHRDKQWGDWLHRSLETFRIPAQFRSKISSSDSISRRLYPVFRDREELPTSSDLGGQINAALEQSRTLVVICSPNSARSRWVNEEILAFKRLQRTDRILCLIVDGEPNASDDPDRADEECFPEALRYALNDDGELTDTREEPIAADARKNKDGKHDALLKLAAGIIDVGFDDLKRRDLQRQVQRWIRLSVAAACLLAVATGLALYAYQARNEALRQQQIAQENYKKARSAVDRFFIEVSDKELFETHGLQKLQDKLLRDGLEFYEGFLADRGDETDLLLETAQTHRRIGEMANLIGDRDKALESYRQCDEILAELLIRTPGEFDLRLHRAELQDNVSVTLWDMDRRKEALGTLAKAQAELTELIQEQPSRTDAQLAWMIATRNLGPFQRSAGMIDEARQTYRTAWETALEEGGDHRDPLASVGQADVFAAVAAFNLGVLCQENDHDLESARHWLFKARQSAEESLRSSQSEVGANNDRSEIKILRELLCSIHTYLGVNYTYNGDAARSKESTLQGLNLATILAEQNPDVTNYQEQVANLSSNLAVLHSDSSEAATAEELHQTAVRTFNRLVLNHPGNQNYRYHLGQAHNNLAIHFVNGRQLQKAVEEYGKAIDQIEQVLADTDGSTALILQLVNTNRNLGSALFELGNAARAKTCYEAARGLVKGLSDSASGLKLADYLSIQASIHGRLAAIDEHLNDNEASNEHRLRVVQVSGEEIDTLKSELDQHPEDGSTIRRLARVLNNHGQTLLDLGRPDEAETALLQVRDLYKHASNPDDLEDPDRALIAHAFGNLGWIHLRGKAYQSSVQHSRNALNFNSDLSWVKMNLGNAYLCNSEFDVSKTVFAELLAASGNAEKFRQSLREEFNLLNEMGIHHPDMNRLLSALFSAESE